MNDELTRGYERWRDAEDAGLEEAADEACLALFAASGPDPIVSREFTARTLAAIAETGIADAARARRVRRIAAWSGIAAATVGLYVGGPWLLAAGSWLLVGLINLLVGATVQVATSVQSGADAWSVVSAIGRALATFVSSPGVTIAMLAMQVVAMGALVALQRLLGSDRESLK
jgi:hypothetical protein